MRDFFKNKIGLVVYLTSLITYCLVKLPLNLSVVCANENEGFSLTYGQNLLISNQLTPGRGPLFIFIYALILKIFGFNTWSIIALHYIQTIIVIIIGTLLYFILKKVLKSDFFGGLSTALWIILISTPIGTSGLVCEIRSHYALEPEYFCVLFSLLSVLCLMFGDFFRTQNKTTKSKERVFSFLAGLSAVLAFMIKATGAVLSIATVFWFISLYIFNRKEFNFPRIIFYFVGLILGLLFFSVVLYVSYGDHISSWKNYFLIGSYTHEHLTSIKSLLSSVLKFMTRYTNSKNNFSLFLIAFLFFAWGLIKGILPGNKTGSSLLWLLISIWGVGNVCGIIMPGMYQPYYYHLIWPLIAIVFVLGFYQIFSYLKQLGSKPIIFFVSLLFLALFIFRIVLAVPAYNKMTKDLSEISIFNQPQSFQDPVLPYDAGSTKRPGFMQIADLINILLSNKKSTLYIFNLNESGRTGLTPLSYIYAKRYSPTTIDCDLLKVDAILTNKLKILKKDLLKNHPEILIVSKSSFLHPWQIKYMMPFLKWFGGYIYDNYRFETTYDYIELLEGKKTETFIVYRKLK